MALPSPHFTPLRLLPLHRCNGRPTNPSRTRAGALREWREYDDALKEKDLKRALGFLRSIETLQDQNFSSSQSSIVDSEPFNGEDGELGGLLRGERNWGVLDACLNADDMKLVGSAYGFLQSRGFLPSFGKCRNIGMNLFGSVKCMSWTSFGVDCVDWIKRIVFETRITWIVLDGPRDVNPTYLKSSTGLEASKLSPKKWGLSGNSTAVFVGFLGGVSFLINQGIDIRPNLAAILGLAMIDAVFLGGCCLAQISSYWPPFRRRILVHEAGHLLTAYLMGCPIRGVILDPIVAMQMGIQGQAGTQFWDEKLEKELAKGRLSSSAFDRYCMVLFAGIAAEALIYGEAEGGENDENLFRSICLLFDPPLSTAQMSNQARWSVLQSFNLLKWHKNAHKAAVKALESRSSLSVVIRRIEEAMVPT